MLSLGVVGSSHKENEQRAPLHPAHLARIPEELRAHLFLERGYGVRFGVSDQVLAGQVAGLLDRGALFDRCKVVLLAKPTEGDFDSFRPDQVLWGWPHCVQGPAITQVSIDKRLTWIAWEEMHHWSDGRWHGHVFHLNNELAGYASVLHALQLAGLTGHYGPPRRAAVIGFGSVGRGAVHCLKAQGYLDITLLTPWAPAAVPHPVPGVTPRQFRRVAADSPEVEVRTEAGWRPMAEVLGERDIIVNAILQDTDAPLMWVGAAEVGQLRSGSLIVDVSCDAGMGFAFARPTGFEDPTFAVPGADQVTCYAVDHSPSYLWQSATHAISEALLPFLGPVMAGPAAWASDETIRRAIEIRDGVVQNPKILRFQGRAEAYPHPHL